MLSLLLYTKENLSDFSQHKSRRKAIHFYLSQILITFVSKLSCIKIAREDTNQQQCLLSSLSPTFLL